MHTRIMQLGIAFLVVLFLASHAVAVLVTADDASFQVPAGGSVASNLSLLVSGFIDPDFGVIAPPAHGQVTVNASTGAFLYELTFNPGYTGPDSFSYRAFEASISSISDTGVISITVLPP